MTRRLSDPVIILTGRDAAMLWQAANLNDLRIKARLRNDTLYMLLVDIYRTALDWHSSGDGKPEPTGEETEKSSNWRTPTHIAESVGVTPRTIRNDITSGRLPAIKNGQVWMIPETDALTYIASRRQP